MITFHGFFRSSSAHRCRIAFNLKGVAYRFVPVALTDDAQKTPEYLALNPQALVPTLEIDGLTLTQSPAILEWLDETYPTPPLLPDSADLRARVRAFASVIGCDVHPLQNLRVLQYLNAELGADQATLDRWCQRWLGDGLAACEALLNHSKTAPNFCFGDAPGLADVYLVPQIFSAHRFNVDLKQMPRLRAVFDACMALPAFARAAPANQPDAPHNSIA